MMPRDIFRTTREKLQPVFVIEQDNKSPYAASLSRKPLQIQNFKFQDSLTHQMEPPLAKRKKPEDTPSSFPQIDSYDHKPKFQVPPHTLNMDTQLAENMQAHYQSQPLQGGPQFLYQSNSPDTRPTKKSQNIQSKDELSPDSRSSEKEFVNPAPFTDGKQDQDELNLEEYLARLGDEFKSDEFEVKASFILQRILKESLKWDLQSGDYERHYRETSELSDYQVLRRIEDIGEVARQQDEQMLTLQREMQRSGVIRFQ